MTLVLVLAAAWPALCIPAALLIGRGIRLADEKEGTR